MEGKLGLGFHVNKGMSSRHRKLESWVSLPSGQVQQGGWASSPLTDLALAAGCLRGAGDRESGSPAESNHEGVLSVNSTLRIWGVSLSVLKGALDGAPEHPP